MTQERIYSDWFVLQVKAGREVCVKQVLDQAGLSEFQTLVFSKEILHRRRDRDLRLTVPVFPGYIFVHEKIKQAYNYLRERLQREFLRPVAFNGQPARVAFREMEFLLNHTNKAGTFTMSTGSITGGTVVLNRGPLKNMNGRVLFINKKKRKAKVRLILFQREMDISLGIDLLGEDSLMERDYEYSNVVL